MPRNTLNLLLAIIIVGILGLVLVYTKAMEPLTAAVGFITASAVLLALFMGKHNERR